MRRHAVSSYFLNGGPKRVLLCYIYDSFFGNGWTSCQIPVNRAENWGGVPQAWRGGWAEPQGFPESHKRKGLKWVGWPVSCRCWCGDLCGKVQWAACTLAAEGITGLQRNTALDSQVQLPFRLAHWATEPGRGTPSGQPVPQCHRWLCFPQGWSAYVDSGSSSKVMWVVLTGEKH